MRVLMVSKACIAGAYQRKLEEIARLGVELTVVVPPYWRDDAGRNAPLERTFTAGYDLMVEPMAFNGHFHYHFYPWLWRAFERAQPDILHMDEEAYNLATLEGFEMARRTGARPLFFTWQNLVRRYPPPFSWIEQYCQGRAAGAICGNGDSVDVLREKGYSGPTWVIPQFGVDPDLFRPMPEVRDAAQPFTIGFIGRLRERKGELLLVQALAALGEGCRLEILGWGEAEPKVRALASQLGVASRVRIHAAMPSTEVPGFINRLDVLAMPSLSLPSWKEQFGRVLMEAMACGVPTIGSDSGEMKRVIGDAGLLFPEGDVAALTEHLRRLRDDAALRQDLSSRGLARARALFTQQRIAEQTVTAYREVMES